MEVHDAKSLDLWSGKYKIPWDDPDFSGRMLREHLSQEHDLASRKQETIDAQVAWIHEHACRGKSCRILDLGCGPGLYLLRLTDRGHVCRGIDFGPASIDYARAHLSPECEVILGDLRETDFGDGFDVVMMVFGEINVFSPDECAAILQKAHRALVPDGVLLIEIHTFDVVKDSGKAANSWYRTPSGLFSERPHFCLQESEWVTDQAVTVQRFYIIDETSGRIDTYRNTIKAWTDDTFQKLLMDTGFMQAKIYSDWPTHSDDLKLWLTRKGEYRR